MTAVRGTAFGVKTQHFRSSSATPTAMPATPAAWRARWRPRPASSAPSELQ